MAQHGQGHAATATAPAVVARCASARRATVVPSSCARAAAAPGERDRGAPARVADDLDLQRAQDVERQRLRHGLLRAEARRQVLARAARGRPA